MTTEKNADTKSTDVKAAVVTQPQQQMQPAQHPPPPGTEQAAEEPVHPQRLARREPYHEDVKIMATMPPEHANRIAGKVTGQEKARSFRELMLRHPDMRSGANQSVIDAFFEDVKLVMGEDKDDQKIDQSRLKDEAAYRTSGLPLVGEPPRTLGELIRSEGKDRSQHSELEDRDSKSKSLAKSDQRAAGLKAAEDAADSKADAKSEDKENDRDKQKGHR